MIVHHLILIIEKNNFLLLAEGPIDGVNDSTDIAGKKISINISAVNTKFCFLSLHCNGDEGYLYVNKTVICKFKVNYNISCMIFVLEAYQKILKKMNRVKFL